MESIIVHPKNPMELSALKITLKEMGIKYEKFHINTSFKNSKSKGEKPYKKPENFSPKKSGN